MVDLSDFRLVTELFENSALIDEDLNLVFMGKSLRQILESHNIDIDFLQLNNPSASKQNCLFRDTVNSVILTGEPALLKPDASGVEFLFLRSTEGVLLGLKEKIVRITKIENELQDSVKELECLYNISKEYESRKTLADFLENSTRIIQAGFQDPSSTIVNIELGNKTYGDTNWDPKDIRNMLGSGIYLQGEKKGDIKVYIKKGQDSLEDEQKLIDEISDKISRILEKAEKTRYLEKQQKILTAKNEALVKLTEECYQKREKLRTFFRAITDKIVVIDRNFNIVMSNKDEIGDSGKCYSKFFELRHKCKNCPAEMTFSSARDSFNEHLYKDRHYMLRTYPILGIDGRVERVLEVCNDITDQRNMEAKLIQSYKLASLGKLVAGVAHEINNPNTFILGNLKIVQEAFKDIFPILDRHYSENRDLRIARLNYEVFKDNIIVLINDMINGANRTKKIVGDLRNFAKKDEGGLTEPVNLNEIIRNNLTLTSKHLKKHAQLEIELNEKIPFFTGNIYKIEQVFLNLALNASEAIESGEGLIRIKTDYDEASKEVILIVSDNGIGIEEANLRNIFDPFFTTKRNKGGTGLGLSITYGIIKDLGGRIEVTSRSGAGATFTVRFPVK
ncbi:MAG: ATP-binding protein [Ignavibacteriales bacterium]